MRRLLILPLLAACTTPGTADDLADRMLSDTLKRDDADRWQIADPVGGSPFARQYPQACATTAQGSACSAEVPVPGAISVNAAATLHDETRCTAKGTVGPHHPGLSIARLTEATTRETSILITDQDGLRTVIDDIGDPARFIAFCRTMNEAA